VLRLIQEEHVTSWSPIGGTGPRVIDHPRFEKYDVSSLRNMGFGGGPTSPALRERMQAAFPNAAQSLANGYGSSETVAAVSSNAGAEYERFPTSGASQPPATVAGDRHPVARDRGRIHVRAYNMLATGGTKRPPPAVPGTGSPPATSAGSTTGCSSSTRGPAT
jgi:acyl-CoA synthetase (AMP-forming)/AMP-acid ligase II